MTCGAWIREPRLFLFEIREGGSSPSWWRHVAGRPGPLRERGSPGETDGHKPAKYFHPRHFQWPAALPATAGNRLAAIPMLRCNWKNPATPQPRLSVSAIRPPANHRRETLGSKSPHGRLQRASNGQRKCKAPQPSAARRNAMQHNATENRENSSGLPPGLQRYSHPQRRPAQRDATE